MIFRLGWLIFLIFSGLSGFLFGLFLLIMVRFYWR